MRALVLLLALALSAPAAADERTSLEAEVAHVLRLAHDSAPHRSWDDTRVAMPRSVRWHLAPPDRDDREIIRRSGWIEAAGRQAGIAVCGAVRQPELVALRISGSTNDDAPDGVIEELRASGVALERMPSAHTDRELYGVGGDADSWLERIRRCTPEGAASMRQCNVTYVVNVRPNLRSAPLAQECHTP